MGTGAGVRARAHVFRSAQRETAGSSFSPNLTLRPKSASEMSATLKSPSILLSFASCGVHTVGGTHGGRRAPARAAIFALLFRARIVVRTTASGWPRHKHSARPPSVYCSFLLAASLSAFRVSFFRAGRPRS